MKRLEKEETRPFIAIAKGDLSRKCTVLSVWQPYWTAHLVVVCCWKRVQNCDCIYSTIIHCIIVLDEVGRLYSKYQLTFSRAQFCSVVKIVCTRNGNLPSKTCSCKSVTRLIDRYILIQSQCNLQLHTSTTSPRWLPPGCQLKDIGSHSLSMRTGKFVCEICVRSLHKQIMIHQKLS